MSTTDRPLRRDARRNRERVLAAAREVFGERGTEATLAEVAARAGVGVGTIYRRYTSKAALLEDLLDESMTAFEASVEEALAEPDSWQAFVGFLERIEEGFAENRVLGDVLVGTEGGEPGARERHARASERLLAPVGALIERAKADGRLRADFEPDDVGMIHSMLATVIRETHGTDPELWRRYFAIVVRGLERER